MKVFPTDPEPGEYRFVNIPRVGRRIAYVLSVTNSLSVVITYAASCSLGYVRWSYPQLIFFVDVIKEERPSPYEIENVVKIIGSPLARIPKVYAR